MRAWKMGCEVFLSWYAQVEEEEKIEAQHHEFPC